jgi:SHS2 domain-containing protein
MEIFHLLDVTADVGIECKGTTLKELFNAALAGLYYIIFDSLIDYKKLPFIKSESLKIGEKDISDILFMALEEAIYLIYQKKMVLNVEEINEEWGLIKYNIYECHVKIENEVKAVTLHNYIVERQENNNLWYGRIIFDV